MPAGLRHVPHATIICSAIPAKRESCHVFIWLSSCQGLHTLNCHLLSVCATLLRTIVICTARRVGLLRRCRHLTSILAEELASVWTVTCCLRHVVARNGHLLGDASQAGVRLLGPGALPPHFFIS